MASLCFSVVHMSNESCSCPSKSANKYYKSWPHLFTITPQKKISQFDTCVTWVCSAAAVTTSPTVDPQLGGLRPTATSGLYSPSWKGLGWSAFYSSRPTHVSRWHCMNAATVQQTLIRCLVSDPPEVDQNGFLREDIHKTPHRALSTNALSRYKGAV